MESDDIVLSQLATLGLTSVNTETLQLGKVSCEELYAILWEGLRLIDERSGQAARNKAEGVKSGISLLPKKVPKSVSTRCSICENIVKELNLAGCEAAGDFNAVMYPTLEGNRVLLKWMSDAVMKATEMERQRAVQDSGAEQASAGDRGNVVQRGLLMLREKVEEGRRGVVRRKVTTVVAARAAKTTTIPVQFRFHAVPLVSPSEPERSTYSDAIAGSTKKNLAAQPRVGDPSTTTALGIGLYNSIVDHNAQQLPHQESFSRSLQTGLTGEMDPVDPTAAGSTRRKAAAAAKPIVESGSSAMALFYDTSEQGLDAEAYVSKRMEEQQAQAAVDEIQEKARTAEERLKQRAEEAHTIQEQLDAAKAEYAMRKSQLKALRTMRTALEQEIAEGEAEEATSGAARASRRTALAEREEILVLMENAETSLEQLQEELSQLLATQSSTRDDLLKKMKKVEIVRDQLNEELVEAGAGREEALRTLKADCKQFKTDVKEKEEEVAKLTEMYEHCPKDIDRSKYHRYIFDMTSNLQRQQEEVEKVSKDTAASDETIAKLSEDVKTIFQKLEASARDNAGTSKGDTFSKDAFTKLVELRQAYIRLVTIIQERGQLRKENHTSEEKAAKLRRSVGEYNIEAVERDLDQVAKELLVVEAYRQQQQSV